MARILLFSRTAGYRHDSIPHAADVIEALASGDGHQTTRTEDPGAFTERSLAGFDLTLWLSPSGDVLTAANREAFAAWLRAGGAYAGVHSATACEYGWPEYGAIAGAVFDRHSDLEPATVRVADPNHPSTAGLPGAWTHVDEWYAWKAPPADRAVLLTVDRDDGAGGGPGPRPVAWHGRYGGGRTWYTALGHESSAYDSPILREHLRGGLRSLVGGEGQEDADG